MFHRQQYPLFSVAELGLKVIGWRYARNGFFATRSRDGFSKLVSYANRLAKTRIEWQSLSA